MSHAHRALLRAKESKRRSQLKSMCAQPVNLMVFREGRRDISACNLRSRLADRLRDGEPGTPANFLNLLLLAGELECGIADAGLSHCQQSPGKLESITDFLAAALVGVPIDCLCLAESLESIPMPDRIKVSSPEGFAYYALHPLAYSEAMSGSENVGDEIAVIGIRSIGTTLSAVVAAEARRKGKTASRITVRPHGHPYNRELRLAGSELEFVEQAKAAGADFLIVDEGPGLSGSSFLAVAEALAKAGVAREKITLLCGHQPDFDSLRADNASERARQFRWQAVNSAPRIPEIAGEFLGGGQWRKFLSSSESEWPAVWTWLERLKYRSSGNSNDQRLYKFVGLGHYGEAVLEREQRIAEAAFSPMPRQEADGFASYPWLESRRIEGRRLEGRPMLAADLNEDVLARLADYCAFRGAAFAAELSDLASLQHMTDHNLRELGLCEVGCSSILLELKRPVIADGHMQPHEWLRTNEGTILKTDSGSHGDDHFFPGPTDIAWDLAGAIVEWQMTAEQSATLLDLYRQKSGDDVVSRIEHFVTAYSVFRCAYCLMAANALGEGDEAERFLEAAEKYRRAIQIPTSTASTATA
jgi:hypothetical protein